MKLNKRQTIHELKILAIGGAIIAAMFAIVWAVRLSIQYSAMIATGIAYLGAAYCLGYIIIYFTQQAKRNERNERNQRRNRKLD